MTSHVNFTSLPVLSPGSTRSSTGQFPFAAPPEMDVPIFLAALSIAAGHGIAAGFRRFPPSESSRAPAPNNVKMQDLPSGPKPTQPFIGFNPSACPTATRRLLTPPVLPIPAQRLLVLWPGITHREMGNSGHLMRVAFGAYPQILPSDDQAENTENTDIEYKKNQVYHNLLLSTDSNSPSVDCVPPSCNRPLKLRRLFVLFGKQVHLQRFERSSRQLECHFVRVVRYPAIGQQPKREDVVAAFRRDSQLVTVNGHQNAAPNRAARISN